MRALVVAALIVLFAPFAAVAADGPAYREGVHYLRLAPEVRQRNPAKIEVVELFSYGCPHCFHFEAPVAAWKKQQAEDVDFWRSPVTWNAQTTLQARVYYTAQALGVLDRVHTPFFEALHVQQKPLNSKAAIARFFADHGVDAGRFDKTFDSFGVDSQVKQAGARALSYRIEGTPELVVAGRYRVSGRELRDQAEMLKVVDFLVEKERAERASR